MMEAERAAFKYAAQLCREYRKTNKRLKIIVGVLLIALIAAIMVILWMMN